MRTWMLIALFIISLGNIHAQKEKIKGNKIVVTEQKPVDAFHTIQLYDNFEVTIQEDSDNLISIEADSNLQEVINISVEDSVLTIKSDKRIKRSKALNIKIGYAQDLKKIISYNKVHLKSTALIKTPIIRIESNDDTEVFLSIEADQTTSVSNGKSNVELHVKTNEAFYQVNEDAELKGIVETDSLKVDLYQKGYTKLEGKTTSMLLRADGNADFYGEKLTSEKTSLIAEGSSDCYVVTNQEITIEAKDESEIYLLGEPAIKITQFANEATLYKKKIDYSPGLLKL
ncbi:GIN domain-containing protein [Aquimarina litoralis]